MKLALHPDATKNFNGKAEKLVTSLSIKKAPFQNDKASFQPEVHISASFSDKEIIGPIKLGLTDLLGQQSARYFRRGNEYIGLFDESYTNLERLAEAMQKTRILSKTVSVGLIKDLLFDWIEKKYKQEISETMTEYVLSRAETQIKDLEIWIPIFQLHIQSELRIGNIAFKTIGKKMIDGFQEKIKPTTPEQEIVARQFLAKERKELQGFAAATIKLIAEPERASEIAFAETERSVSLLRFFSPANLMPQLISYCTPLGRKHLESQRHLVVKEGEIIGGQTGLTNNFEPAWLLTDGLISRFRRLGLDVLGNLLIKDSRTEYEDELLDSLFLYSKSSLTGDLSEKIICILAALEPLLLKDSTEPIQQNIGMRLAFLIGKTSDERILIKKNFTDVYGLRSRFVHHGSTIDDLKTLETFMRNAWFGFCALIQGVNRFETKQQLLNQLEERIYSSPDDRTK